MASLGQGEQAIMSCDRARQAELDAARLLLAKLGVDPVDLLSDAVERPDLPTFSSYIPQVAGALSESTRRSYSSYWKYLEERWGARHIDEPSATEIKQLAEVVRGRAVVRRNSRGGRSAAENFIAATRCLYKHAVDDGLIAEADNPARKVSKPRRAASTRRALPDAGLAEIYDAAGSTGDDPQLDTLLLRLHTETACRRSGALNLRLRDLEKAQCLIYLREKGGTVRWQPVSPTLMNHLCLHAEHRDATGQDGPLLRYRHGEPITSRRYDYLWDRIGRHVSWVRTQGISTHWLRHTTLTWVERHFGFAIAHAYAGHHDASDNATATYVKASLSDVANALAALAGEAHPLADPSTPMFPVKESAATLGA